jgi:imidazolonepropionase-like amidohydrolase
MRAQRALHLHLGEPAQDRVSRSLNAVSRGAGPADRLLSAGSTTGLIALQRNSLSLTGLCRGPQLAIMSQLPVARPKAALPFLAVALLSAACAASPPAAPADLVILNTTIVAVETGTLLPARTVVIRDGVIAAILGAGDAVPPAARAIDGTGRFLIPGLWDMHVHFRGGEDLVQANRALLPLYIANGVTTVRDAGGDMTHHLLDWRRDIETGALVGPRILTSGPKLDGPTGGWPGSIRLESPAQVPAALDSLQRIGVDYVKIYDGTLSRDVFLAIVEETERRGMIVTGHMPFSVRFGEAVERGLDATEHLYYAFKGTAANEDSVTRAIIATANSPRPLGFWAALSLLQPRHDTALARRTYRRMAERGTAVVPTLHIGRVLSFVDEVDHTADAELRYLDPAIEATYAGRVQSARRSSAAARSERRELQQIFAGMVPRMHEAGVTILAGSDAGASNSYVYPGFSLHAELDELVRAALTPAVVLRAATRDAAVFMRRGHELGVVRTGHRADLVLLGRNPLLDITATRDIAYVVANGRVFGAGDIAALLAGVAR